MLSRQRSSLDDEFPVGGVIGIDPGGSGGIAYCWGVGKAQAWKMPDTDTEVWQLIERLSNLAVVGVLERVHAMPKQGVSSSFKFGMRYGEVKMALMAARTRIEHVQPERWQTVIGCRSKGDKNVTKRRAQELFPRIEQKITHAIADALLISEYGRRTYLGGFHGHVDVAVPSLRPRKRDLSRRSELSDREGS